MFVKEVKDITPLEWYAALEDDEQPFLLDSSVDHENCGRYSFVGSDPFLTFRSYNDEVVIKLKGAREKRFRSNPFDELGRLLAKYKRNARNLPFTSGAVGYFAYEMGRHIETLPKSLAEDIKLPHSFFGFYDTIYIHDHLLKKSYVACDDTVSGLSGRGAEAKSQWLIDKITMRTRFDIPEMPSLKDIKLESNFTPEEYKLGVKKVLGYIESGDIYQANVSQRFAIDYDGDALAFYKNFIEVSPAPFGAVINVDGAVIMSNSPERYLKREGDYIQTRPIKGTRPRGKCAASDERLKRELKASVKDQAEHLMIVDLERNDLGRVSEYGSVQVEEFGIVESYSNVHHLVSTVSGRLKEGTTSIDCIKNSFPGGSITGAPKIRSMEIISEIEPTARSVYTGAIGYFDFSGDFDFNIAIRTAIYYQNKIYFQVGGGIVADSDPDLEYDETIVKAESFLKTAGIEVGRE